MWAAGGLDAFGIHVRSDLPLVGATEGAPALYGPTVQLSRLQAGRWAGGNEPLLERRHPDGSLGMRVARLAEGSYWIEAPGHGTFKVAGDGSFIGYDRLAEARWRWHRPLCAQVLPLAATLHGLELLHASAVVMADRAVAFVAQSGGGKTSLAVHLLACGAPLVTDDVLALEDTGRGIVAHPGAPMANVAAEQVELLPTPARARLGSVIGASDKVHVEVSNISTEPLPLGAVFFLRRSEQVGRLTFEEVDTPDPRDLLGATFMPHIVTPERLMTQLAICASIAAAVPVFKLGVPAGMTAPQLARAVERQVTQIFG